MTVALSACTFVIGFIAGMFCLRWAHDGLVRSHRSLKSGEQCPLCQYRAGESMLPCETTLGGIARR